jgi:hypothetical protein
VRGDSLSHEPWNNREVIITHEASFIPYSTTRHE